MSEQRQKLDKRTMGIREGIPLQVSAGGIEELRADIQRLMDIEAIKQLKHAYFRCIDTANLEELANLLHDEVEVDFRGGTYRWKMSGKQEYLKNVGATFSKQSIGQHQGHHPEIQILSETEATGIWYLEDNIWVLNHNAHTHGTLLYWDRYVKEHGGWLIRETRYERLYEMNEVLEEAPAPSSHYLGVHGTEPQI